MKKEELFCARAPQIEQKGSKSSVYSMCMFQFFIQKQGS